MALLHVPPTENGSIFRPPGQCFLPRESRPFANALLGLLCVIPLLGPTVHAGLIYWGSPGFVRNSDSKDQLWTADFTMTLGVFQAGFVPVEANRAEWLTKWTELGKATFDGVESRFAGAVDASLTLPAGVGRQVYFWARNGQDLGHGPEWLLVKCDDWQWPLSSSAATLPLVWTTGSKVVPVLGSMNVRGSHLVSSRTVPLTVGYEEWLVGFFPEGTGDIAPGGDEDGDGLTNRLEYFLGSDPSNAASVSCPVMVSTPDGISLSLKRNPAAPSVFAVETSGDLRQWSAAAPVLVQDRPDLIEAMLPPAAKTGSQFFRFKLETPQP